MIIEISGISGSGKTTLLKHIIKDSNNKNIRTLDSIWFHKFFDKKIFSKSFSIILFDLCLLPFVGLGILKHFRFFKFCLTNINCRSKKFFNKLILIRSVCKKLGLLVYFRNKQNKNLIFVDEGIIHSSHVIFINGEIEKDIDIKTFTSLVPKPDLIIYVYDKIEDVIKRTLQRDDPPLKNSDHKTLSNFIIKADLMFKDLMKNEHLKKTNIIKVDSQAYSIKDLLEYINGIQKTSFN